MNALASLAVLTLTAPSQAARTVLAQAWPREALWSGLALAVVLNTIVYTLMNALFPAAGEVAKLMPGPGVYFALMLVLQAGFAMLLTVTGRWLGGTGTLAGILAVLVWLQLLQVAGEAAVLVLYAALPPLADLASVAVAVLAFFILLHFINEAHQLGSLWRAFAAVLMSSIAFFFAFLFLLGLFGPDNLGLPDNV